MQIAEGSGVLDTLIALVKKNGELFGAYRAVGSGGMVGEAMRSLLGQGKTRRLHNVQDVAQQIQSALEQHQPAVTGTSAMFMEKLAAHMPELLQAENWYMESHAYTVVAIDPAARTITLRNPWGQHPAPDGQFKLPLAQSLAAFDEYTLPPAEGSPATAGTR